ncbi:MAG: carbohydrate kinase family protein [Candidatus Hodarchaeota archaeon]
MHPRILSIGDANIDLIAKIERYPIRGGTAYGEPLRRHLGGSAITFAIGVARLGETVGYISKLGSDDFGKLLLNGLKEEGVDTSHISIEEGGHTGTIFVIVDEEGERTFFAFRNGCADTKLSPKDISEEYIRQTKLLQVSGIALVEPISRKASLMAMKYAQENSVIVSFDPNLRLEKWELPKDLRKSFEEAIRLSDIVLAGSKEVNCLMNTTDHHNGAVNLLNLGPKIIVLKLGGKGSTIITKDTKISIPAFPVVVRDTTGAGDAYNAGFIVGYVNGWTLKEIATFANAVGAIRITRKDMKTGLPTRQETLAFLEKHLERKWRS